jgi:Big-like domain-containing protein
MRPMTGGLFWGRNNTDFPEMYRNDPTRSERISDHDPVVAYFERPQTTTTAVAVAPNPAVVNQPVTLTATVSAAAGSVDAGSVTFRDNGDVLAAGVPAHDGRAITTVSPAAGDHTISATYSGALLFAASTSPDPDAPLKVEPLVLSLPADVVAEATGPAGAPVSFSAFASNDVETVPATCLPGSGSTFAIAPTTVTCSATDPYGNTVGGQFNVTVRDTTPPAVTVSAHPMVLWPPNHQMVPIAVMARALDLVDPAPACLITSIASSEPDNGPRDGNTAGDFAITGALTAALRAERAGGGPGRAYTIAVRCRDAAGNATTSTVAVVVPHSVK